MSKNVRIVFWIFFIGLITLASCSLRPSKNFQSNETVKAEHMDSDLIIVGFSQLGSESDWRTANTKSIQNAFSKKNGFSLIFSNGRQRQENQIKAIRSFIFQEVDYIVIAPVTETGWDTVLQEAKQAGIPVIIVDRMIETEDDSLYVAWVGTDKYAEGSRAGQWLEQHLKGKNNDTINIVVLEGTPNSTAQIGRSKGFEDIAKKHKNWNILARENGDFTKAKGKEVMEKLLQKYDDIDVLVSQNDDMTFGAIEAIREMGLTCGVNGDITIISFDAVSEAFDKMEEGLINVDIECNPLQGPMIAQIIGRLERGEKVEKISYVTGKVFEAERASRDRIGRSY
ncbi:ABC transporter substrate-binding protein [Ruminiclostridium herbifermentans]|uniref:ABC transporter substrate-binding protein n=1 Tax=Ruminiclostridium herbifermentans TaxID=2488810 RepID=A0A4U7JKJ3_9FIRM|nr:ABC transporter substrate-binding protein [Ruminiclostridium herbifermentans]QNU67033.1 ABC transporter substrate-binding protein [Ruminiclostridium herbifermentans]